MTTKRLLVLAFVLALGAYFRFYLITEMPGGLFPDEAANGLDIMSMQQGDLQPFYERGNGREALFFYMLWGSITVFGKGPWQHHIVSALVGLVSVLLCFLITRRLLRGDGPEPEAGAEPTALLAAFLMAVSSWHVVLSRTAFRANTVPLIAGMVVYFFLCSRQAATVGKRLFFSALAGASLALGFYTYISFRMMVPLLGVLILLELFAAFRKHELMANIKRWVLPALLCVVAFSAVIFPIARYFYQHPGTFVGRSSQVSVFNPELNGGHLASTVLEVFRRSVFAYFSDGDLNWRHNISGEPFLSKLINPFFGFALVCITILALLYTLMPRRFGRYFPYALLGGWFWAMLAPVVATAEGIPHGLRAIGTIPAVFIITAIGLYKVYHWLQPQYVAFLLQHKRQVGFFNRHAVNIWAVIFLAALTFQTNQLYFGTAYASPENFYAFRSDLTPVSEYLLRRCNKEHTFLVLDSFSVQTPDYLTTVDPRAENACNRPYQLVDPEHVENYTEFKSGDYIVFAQSTIHDITDFKNKWPKSHLVTELRNKFGQAVLAVYQFEQ